MAKNTKPQLSADVRDAILSLPGSKAFYEIVIKAMELHASKNQDYSGEDTPFENFFVSAAEANTTPRTAIRVLIGTKRGRKLNLERPSKKVVNYESLNDTKMDQVVYALLELALEVEHPDLIDKVFTPSYYEE